MSHNDNDRSAPCPLVALEQWPTGDDPLIENEASGSRNCVG